MSFEEKSYEMKKALLLICSTILSAYNTFAQSKQIERPDGKTTTPKQDHPTAHTNKHWIPPK